MKRKKHRPFYFSARQFAGQGNAVLGIRDSGKSYTASAFAEKLLDQKIPIVAIDPIGVWRNLRIGKTAPGYPVIVVGDNGDFPLSVETIVPIVRAAMIEKTSLVIDLYSVTVSKAVAREIVFQTVQTLLYNNKEHGIRHIFIEEAAEFCPQQVRPDCGKVYSQIEALARMGGNTSLGYTLINQRSEQVNKAVLELCDQLFLHRQKGRHSISALAKWLAIGNADNTRAIIQSLPTLKQGECWAWQAGGTHPNRIQIHAKKTVHPNRKNLAATTRGVSADVTALVERMKKHLDIIPSEFDSELDRLKAELEIKSKKLTKLEAVFKEINKVLKPDLRRLVKKLSRAKPGASGS